MGSLGHRRQPENGFFSPTNTTTMPPTILRRWRIRAALFLGCQSFIQGGASSVHRAIPAGLGQDRSISRHSRPTDDSLPVLSSGRTLCMARSKLKEKWRVGSKGSLQDSEFFRPSGRHAVTDPEQGSDTPSRMASWIFGRIQLSSAVSVSWTAASAGTSSLEG